MLSFALKKIDLVDLEMDCSITKLKKEVIIICHCWGRFFNS